MNLTAALTLTLAAPTAPAAPRPDDPPQACAGARKAIRWYRARTAEHRARMGASRLPELEHHMGCTRARARAVYWRGAASANRKAALAYWRYHYAWWEWMPDKWARIGACETGYGKRPGQWGWNSGTYQGAFGFYHGSWDKFVPRADPKAGPYPSEAYLATPRQQYEVAMAIWRAYGFSGWGCRNA